MSNKRIRLIVEGRVQGVWYRDSTRRKAQELEINGWVKNRRDGNVEIVVEGSEDSIVELKKWCYNGPPNAVVTDIKETIEEFKGEFSSFDIVF